ncbi:MAG: IclR family transcriptional regulator domain-containing protein [Candidatus Dormibacteria bacterium]
MAEALVGPGPERTPGFVQSLERGLAVIRAFGHDRRQLQLSEVARLTGLSRATARRFLLTLVDLGYARSDGRYFSLRPSVLELGYAYLSGLSLTEVAQPHLEELMQQVHESSSISVLDGNEVVYVLRAPAARIMTVAISVGTRFPAYATSMGRVLLAGLAAEELEEHLTRMRLEPLTSHTVKSTSELRRVLDQVRHSGYAAVDQELEDGLRSVAVPLHDGSGAVIAAMNVSVHAVRVTMEALRRDFLPPLRMAAAQIEADLAPQGGR